MAFSHDAAIKARIEHHQEEYAQANAEYEAARLAEDSQGVHQAAERMEKAEHHLHSLNRIASNYVAQQQRQPQGNAYGLSNEEIEVAKNTHSGGTVDDRIKEYAQNKAKYQHMRSTGEYRDDQGTVRR